MLGTSGPLKKGPSEKELQGTGDLAQKGLWGFVVFIVFLEFLKFLNNILKIYRLLLVFIGL